MRFQLSVLSTSLALALGVGLSMGISASAFAQAAPATSAPTSFTASFSGKTIAPNDNISINFANAINAGDGQYAVIVGTEDLTANFRWVSPTQLDGVFAAMPLPAGTTMLKVYQIAAGNQWQELGQLEIIVAAAAGAGGAKVPVFKPTLIVGSKAQLAEAHSAAATPPIRATYADLTAQAGLQTEHGDANWSLKSQINLVGSSHGPEAVDFGSQGTEAPKLDIANYLVEGSYTSKVGVTGVALGHVQAGNNPLIAQTIASRGLSLSHKFSERLDIAAAFQNGTPIVGGLNPLGLNDTEHRLNTLSAGYEVLERAGGMRLETTIFSGVIKPKLTTGVATLQDAEESKGYGLRAKAQNTEATLRADVAYARSTYTPKGDSTLNILPGPAASGNSWYADVAYDLLKNVPLGKDYPLSLTVQGKHEFADMGFKTLGAGAASNFAADTLSLNATLGVLSSQLQLTQRADNVDDNAAFLKNRSQGYSLTVGVPLGQVLDTAKPPLWAPTISLTQGRSHSYADTAFIPSGQTLANLPNVFATTQGLGLNWTVDKLTLSYQLSRTLQDNQQLGVEAMDVADIGHNMTAGYTASEKLSFTGGLGTRTSTSKDTGVQRFNNTAQGGVNWLFGDRYTFTTSISTSRDRDSLGTSDSKVLQANLQLFKLFDFTSFGLKVPGQWTLAYTHSNNNTLGTVVRYQTLNAALSLSFF
jgi:hypothetical protein